MSSCTEEQLNTLLDFLEVHSDLARGLLRSADGRLRSKRLWDEVSQQLNSLGGSLKTTQQWQKVWTDRKYLAKKNAALNRRSFAATGGGEGCPPLASWELKVLSIMGEGFGAPATSARVPVLIPPPAPVVIPPPVMDLDLEVASYAEVSAEQSAPVQSTEEARSDPALQGIEEHEAVQGTRPQRQRRPQQRRRISAVRENILEIEIEKNQILGEIRDEVHGLTAAVKELIELIKSSTTAVRLPS